MLFRLILAFLLLLSTLVTASAIPLYPLDNPALLECAKLLEQKDYKGAAASALKDRETPMRNFILGVSYYRLEKWNEAAQHLEKSLDGFSLLGDYALYYQADALYREGHYDEAIEALQTLKKEYPDNPFVRSAALLHADALFGTNNFQESLNAYRKFVETYPTGSQSVKAVLQAALCLEALGSKEKAAREFRAVWLRYPASPVAVQAEDNLQRLQAENVPVAPYTPEEIFSRGMILFDLHKYGQALQTFALLSTEPLTDKLKARLELKTGQALFKTKRYKDAEQTLARLTANADEKIVCEASYWLARTLARSGNEQRAFELYTNIVENHPQSELADDALFYAALIRKFDGKNNEAAGLLGRLVSQFPSSSLVPNSLWETAWNRYLAKDFSGAAAPLTRLLEYPSHREKALYWLGRTTEAGGDKEQADNLFATLMEEYPYGFYSLHRQSSTGERNNQLAVPDIQSLSSLPIPAGYRRIKALITFGLLDEARTELASMKKKVGGGSGLLDIARLYREIDDYRSAMGLFTKIDGKNIHVWNFTHPKAFSEHVSLHAENRGVPESLAYSIIRAESNFHPTARSPVGAVGLMQLMPATAKFLHKNKSGTFDVSLLKQPELNIGLGIKHMQDLIKSYDGNLVFAVAAYNSGGTPVNRWRKNYPDLQPDEFIENIPYPETREYVKKVFSSMRIYQFLYGLDTGRAKPPATALPEPSAAPAVTLSAVDGKEATQKN